MSRICSLSSPLRYSFYSCLIDPEDTGYIMMRGIVVLFSQSVLDFVEYLRVEKEAKAKAMVLYLFPKLFAFWGGSTEIQIKVPGPGSGSGSGSTCLRSKEEDGGG